MGLNKMFRSKIFIHLLILSASTCLYGQEDENADPDQGPQENVSQRPIEEIQVIGERSLSFLRNEIRREEENLYRIFNELNSHDRFDIKCKVERRTWSYILARNCYPKFFTDCAGLRTLSHNPNCARPLARTGLILRCSIWVWQK